jgi:pyruvate dehydrogenase E1 component
VWSVTSFTQLQRDSIEAERAARLDPDSSATPYVTQLLSEARGPVIAATDYVRAVPDLIRAYVPSVT